MKCPHCGEPVRPGQQRCFACGQPVRGRRSAGGPAPVDARVFVFSGIAVFLVLVVLAVAAIRRSRPAPETESRPRRARRVESTRAARRDSTTVTVRDDRVARAQGRFDKIQRRYNEIRDRSLRGELSPEQRDLAGRIEAGLGRGRSLALSLSGTISREKETDITRDIGDCERELNNLLSRLSRAPRVRPEKPAPAGQ